MLQQLKKEFSQLKVVDCGLWHEQVERIGNTYKPKLSSPPNEVRYQRVKFCDKATRDHMGCAHTSLRCRAIQIVKDIVLFIVESSDIDSKVQQELLDIPLHYEKTLKKFEWSIIQYDIQKSELELSHAEVCENLTSDMVEVGDDERRTIEKKILSVINQQIILNEEIRGYQLRIMETIQRLEMRLN